MDPEIMPGARVCAQEPTDRGRKRPAPGGSSSEDAERKPRQRQKAVRLEDLPPPGVTRWVIRRKAQVVEAVQAGAISLQEVCERYSVSVEEFQSWQRSFERHGLYGLRTTRSQIYRDGRKG